MDTVARPSQVFERGVIEALPQLRGFARKLCGDPDQADDLVQQTAMKALAAHASFEPGTNLGAWLVTILRNQWHGDMRRTGRVIEDPEGAHEANLAGADNPLDGLELEDLRRVLPALPAYSAAILELLVEGQTYPQIAAKLGISEGTVKSRLFRTREKLLLLLDNERGMVRERSQTVSGKKDRAYRARLESKQGDGLRPIDPKLFSQNLQPRPKDQLDQPSTLAWIAIAKLRIDGAYQRKILSNGIRNVRRIAVNFEWCKFSPVIVAPTEEPEVYAIIDGQHRTTAAAMVGVEAVPCQLVHIAREKQAECFAAINGDVTGITSLQMFAARVEAHDPVALNLTTLCTAAGVRIRRTPTAVDGMQPEDTNAIGTLLTCLKNPGPEALSAALRTIRQSAPNQRGLLGAPMIRALSKLFAEPSLRARLPQVIERFSQVNLLSLLIRASTQAKESRQPLVPTLVSTLREFLNRPRQDAA